MKERYAYIRVSSKGQSIDRQIDAMDKVGIDRKNRYIDIQSGKDFERKNYKRLLKKLKSGDELFVKSIDRLGRDYDEIIEQWRKLTKEREVEIVVLDFPLLDTRNQINGITGKFIADLALQILSYVAQIERENIHQRQAEGIRSAKARGVRFGRPQKQFPKNFEKVYQLYKNNIISKREAARRLATNHVTFTNLMNRYEDIKRENPDFCIPSKMDYKDTSQDIF